MTVVPIKSRTDVFAERLDAHLATLPESKRLGFLLDQEQTWQTRYGHFVLLVNKNLPIPVSLGGGAAIAYDFIQTIVLISSRITALDKPQTDYDAQLAAVGEAVA